MHGTRIEMHGRRPAPALRGLVDSYTDYLLDGVRPGLHRGLPSRHLTVVIPLDGPLVMTAMPDPQQPGGAFDVVVGGLHHRAAQIRMPRTSAGLQLALTPAGCRSLLGMPAGQLGSWVGDLRDVLGPRAAEIRERLLGAPTHEARFAALDSVLLRLRADRDRPARPEVVWAWDRLVTAGGSARVDALAGAVGWSRRHLAEQFRTEYGLPPKTAARVLRFERSVGQLRRSPGRRLAEVAARCGFADQAHLARDWRELAGCAPSRWLAEESGYREPTPQSRDNFCNRVIIFT